MEPISIQITEGLDEFMNAHPTFHLALIELVHRYYYDKCFDRRTGKLMDTTEAKYIHNLHQKLVTSTPDWRYIFKKKLDRYSAWEPTNALDTGCKPKIDVNIPTISLTNSNNNQLPCNKIFLLIKRFLCSLAAKIYKICLKMQK